MQIHQLMPQVCLKKHQEYFQMSRVTNISMDALTQVINRFKAIEAELMLIRAANFKEAS